MTKGETYVKRGFATLGDRRAEARDAWCARDVGTILHEASGAREDGEGDDDSGEEAHDGRQIGFRLQRATEVKE